MNSRVNKLLNQFESLNVDAVLITSPLNRRYISGFTGSNGYVYISKNRKAFLTDFRYLEQASKQCPGFEIIDFIKKGEVNTVYDLVKEDGVKSIGFENTQVTYEKYKGLEAGLGDTELVELGNVVERLRMIKDEEELECIKKAAAIGDRAFEHILTFIKPGVTELEVALELEFFMKKNGAEKLSFDSIVASGPHSSLPHAQPTNRKISEGDFVTMDFGCIYKGYCSDMTRTVVIGKASDKQKEIYETVLEAQVKSLEHIKAGRLGVEVDKVARDVITDKGYGDKFGHGLGHCLGLNVHEEPRLSIKDKTPLEENMVVTVEPGIYIPDFGGVRIEDLVVVTKDGYTNFVSSPKELIEL